MGEGFPGFEQFDHAFREHRAGGPRFVDAGAGEDVGAAGTLANARIAIAGEARFAAAAGFA